MKRAHGACGIAVTTSTTCHAKVYTLICVTFCSSTSSTAAASAATCADACSCTAAAVTAIATRSRLTIVFINEISIVAVGTIDPIGSIAARGVHCAAADKVERVAFRQFDARAGKWSDRCRQRCRW